MDRLLGPELENSNVEYWQLCREVILAAGKIAKQDKLILDYQHNDACCRVVPVVKDLARYLLGMASIYTARQAATTDYYVAFDCLNKFACECGYKQVLPMGLLSDLTDKRVRDKYKYWIGIYEKQNHPPIALDEIQLYPKST